MNYLIPIPNGQCLSTKRLKVVNRFIPENSVLRLHLVNEKLSLSQNKKHRPSPYIVTITQKEMDEIKEEINKKAKYNLNEVYILVQSRNLPIVKIEVKDE